MKKFLSLIMVICVMLSFASFAEVPAEIENGVYKTGLVIAAEPITLRIAVARHTGDQSTSYNAKPFVTKSVAETGLNFEFIEMTTDVEVQLSTMLASGDDMPDIFLCSLGNLYEKNMGLFADLSGMLEEWAPTVVDYYNSFGVNWDDLTEDDGSIRRLLTGMYSNPGNVPGNLMYIRTDWLENLGLEMPTTLDEFYDVLVAFKEEDANGDGDPDNELPLDFLAGNNLMRWAIPFGVGGISDDTHYIVKDGVVEPTVNTAAYRAFLEFFHQLYVEGLVNPEGFTQTGDQYNANVKSKLVGCYAAWSPHGFWGTVPDALECYPLPVLASDEYEYLFPSNNPINMQFGFQISENSKHKEAALRWWDYLSSEEMRWLTGRGPEGLCWEFAEDGVTHQVHTYTEEDALRIFEEYGMEGFDWTMPGAAFYMDSWFPVIDTNTSYAPPAEGEVMVQGWMRKLGQDAIGEENFSDWMSNYIIPADVTEKLAFATEGLTDFIYAYRAEAIINGVTDENWDAYVAELEAYGYDYYIEVYQAKLDNNF